MAASPPSSPRLEAGVVLLAAILIRVAFLAVYRESSFFVAPILDSAGHDLLARAIADGDLAAGAPYFRPPLYPWLLAGLYTVADPGPWPGRLLNVTAGITTSLLVWLGARRLGLGRPARLTVGLAMAFWPTELFLEGELLGTPVATALATGGLVLLLRPGSSRETSQEAGWRTCFLAGSLWGMAALARAPLALLVGAGVAGGFARRGRKLAPALAVLVGAALMWIGPALLMSSHGAGFRFPSLQGGINFYAGNHRGADGRGVTIPGLAGTHGWREFEAATRRAAPLSPGDPASPAAADAAWWKLGKTYWKEDPGGALALTGRKALYLLHGYEAPNNRSLYRARSDAFLPLSRTPGLYWPFGLLAPLALVGAFSVVRRTAWRPVLLQAGLICVPLLFFFVNARFRLPAVPPLLLLAVPGALALGRGSRGSWLAFLLLFAAANAPWPGAVREDPAREALARGESALNAGRLDEARARYEEARSLDPAEGRAELGLAVVADREGRVDEASLAFRTAAARGLGGYWALEKAWASFLDRQGQPDAAVPHLRRAVADFPESPSLWGQLGLTLEAVGKPAEARAALQEASERGSRDAEVWNSLARFRLLAGDDEGARLAWDRAVALDPDHFKALYNRGLFFASLGQGELARRDLESALRAASGARERERARQALESIPRSLP